MLCLPNFSPWNFSNELYENDHETVIFLLNSFVKLFEPRHEISNNVVCATSKGSDQPAHMRSLIRAFASCLSILWLLSYWLNTIWRKSKLKRRLKRLVGVYTCQNVKLVEISCRGSFPFITLFIYNSPFLWTPTLERDWLVFLAYLAINIGTLFINKTNMGVKFHLPEKRTKKEQLNNMQAKSFVSVNPLYTYGFFNLVWYNQLQIVHCTYLGVSG